MRLLIVRHAAAVARDTPGLADADRALTPEGRERFEEAAAGLARVTDPPDVLLASPWRRARQTAEILGRAFGGIEPEDLDALAGGTFAAVAKALDLRERDAMVALVGHEPQLSDLLGHLLGSREGDRLAFKKGGAALVDVPGRLAGGGQLVWFLPPKVLRKLG
jgi:phosphohistidine phosphatase